MKNKTNGLTMYIILFLIIMVVLILTNLNTSLNDDVPYTYSDLINDLTHENSQNIIKNIEISEDIKQLNHAKAKVYFTDEATKYKVVEIPDVRSFMDIVHYSIGYSNIEKVTTLSPDKTAWMIEILVPIIGMVLVVFFIFFIIQQAQGGGSGGNKAMSFGKSKAKLITSKDNKTKFADVAGLKEEKYELEEITEFLKNPKKYTDLGAKIPKGVLLVGPPGTGKTLLAKAVAGEAAAPFFSISGSDFVEMFVGVGASRVRDLFETAKKNSPCLIFIDEIDAVGRVRGAGLGGGHDEREQTLNQLLVEMDGFSVNEGIIILAATNRADILDPAILRPGRFDRQVTFQKPDVLGREEILNVHAKNKVMSKDVDLKIIAKTTSGFTGADLENLLNESALISARENLSEVTMETIKKAFIKVGIGTEKKSKVVSEKEKKITAYHEAGHAILFELLSELDPVHIISIIPTGYAGGYTMHLPSEDRQYETKTHMTQSIMALLGGRIAEDIILGDITTGASNDIHRATSIARAMVTKYGMSPLGPIQFGTESHETFLGKNINDSRNYGENIASAIDNEISNIIDTAYKEVEVILKNNIDILHKSAELLVENEKISGKEFRKLFPEGVLIPEKYVYSLKEDFLDV